MDVELPSVRIREWRAGDAVSLARHADNRKVWINLRDRFPHPYTMGDAEEWIRMAREQQPPTFFALDVDGEAVGGIGLTPGEDVHRRSAEIGFWLAEPFWGRGIMTDAVKAVTSHAFDVLRLCRVHAAVYEWNPASMRVLEKAGYQREGRLRRSVTKDGRTIDSILYAAVREPI